ncbi:DNA/RNA nuclease SfsA [Maritalea sp.]|uniref:DNA/RNA nuclease SfsA n=1 Tax=Maritalea sp. TaxID=2003361 RepID=UPI003EF52E39
MRLPTPLLRGTLIKRYKRFLADITLETGEEITAHCANPGAMLGLNMPGLPVYISKSDNPKRKLQYSLELVELPTGLVGINTSYPNKIIGEALKSKLIPELGEYASFKAEVKYGENSRVDFLLDEQSTHKTYLEVKNVHLSLGNALAQFPDCETDRGVKHLKELSNMVEQGHRAINLYLVQRTDCDRFSFAPDLAPKYAAAALAAQNAGVEFLCYDCDINVEEICISSRLPILLPTS